jgi:hypothetical protein
MVGYENGRIEARKVATGQVIAKEFMKSAISGFVKMSPKELACCSYDGEGELV